MEDPAADDEALCETVVFLKHFNDLQGPRPRGKVMYPLDEILLLTLLAVLAGTDSFVDIARFGEKKLDLWRRFRPFRDGTLPRDHLGDIFAALDAEQVQRCFATWVASLTGVPEGVVAIDGKTLPAPAARPGKAPSSTMAAWLPAQTRTRHAPPRPILLSCNRSRWVAAARY